MYRQAHEAGDAEATYSLGTMYDDGEGVKKDRKKAFSLYRQAHKAGNANATYNLGSMYDNGEGVKKDRKKASWPHRKFTATINHLNMQPSPGGSCGSRPLQEQKENNGRRKRNR